MMSRAEIWVQFAAALTFQFVKAGEISLTPIREPKEVADAADRMLEEFDKRFELHESSTGGTWVPNKLPKKEPS